MATGLAVATVKPRRHSPPPIPEKPKAKPLPVTVIHNPDLDAEVKFDPNTGAVVPVEPKKYKLYPSAEVGARVAKCYVCGEVKNKEVMMCVGQNNAEKGSLRYVWRCKTILDPNGRVTKEGCEAGSSRWLKHFAHKSSMGKLWGIKQDGTREKRPGLEEEAMVIGKQIIEKIKEKYSKEISERLALRDKKREAGRKLAATLKKGAEKAGAKNVRVEIKAERKRVEVAAPKSPKTAPALPKKRRRRSSRNVVIRRVRC